MQVAFCHINVKNSRGVLWKKRRGLGREMGKPDRPPHAGPSVVPVKQCQCLSDTSDLEGPFILMAAANSIQKMR